LSERSGVLEELVALPAMRVGLVVVALVVPSEAVVPVAVDMGGESTHE
jgi:hypothetical protein